MASRWILACSFCALALGCRGKGEAGGAATAASAVEKPPVLNPGISALAQAAVPCALPSGVFDPTCTGMKNWIEAREAFVEGKSDPALVAMLADKDEKIRYLASSKLNQFGRFFATDKELAGDVVTAGERERSSMAAMEVGAMVGRVAVHATGTFDRVRAIVKTHPSSEVRQGVLSQLLFRNSADTQVEGLTRESIDDADKKVAMAALRAFWTGGTANVDATCQVYLEHAGGAGSGDVEIAAEASNALAWFGQCASRYGKLLDSLERRVKAGAEALNHPAFASAARHICEDPKSTDADRKRAAAIGRAVVSRADLKSSTRLAGLEAADRCDPTAAGHAFIAKLKGDPDKVIADKARELVAKK